MKKAEQAARTREALIDAAISLFGERGYRATPLKAVAERAGVTHGVIPFHFGSKEGLLNAVTEACFERFHVGVMTSIQSPTRDFGVGDLRALMEAQQRFEKRFPEIGRLFQLLMFESLGPSPELRPHFRAFYDRIHALGCAWVREGQARDAIRADVDAASAVDAILSFFTGLKTHVLMDPERIDRGRIAEAMLAILDRGVTSHTKNNGGEP